MISYNAIDIKFVPIAMTGVEAALLWSHTRNRGVTTVTSLMEPRLR